MTRIFFLVYLFFASLPIFAQDKPVLQISNLKCEYRVNPLSVEATAPKLSWEITSCLRNVKQTAYWILVADSPEALN